MVKINLMGTEEEGEELRKEASYEEKAETRAGTEELSSVPEHEIEEIGPPERKSWLVPTLGVIGLVAALIVAWFLIQGRGRRPETAPGVEKAPLAETGAVGGAEVGEAPEATEPGTPPGTITKPTVTPGVATAEAPSTATATFASAVLTPTILAVREVNRALGVNLGGARLGLLSRSDGQMVVELLGNSDADLQAARQSLLAAFPGAGVRLQTQASKEIEGRTYRQAIFVVNLPASGVRAPTQVRYLDRKQLSTELRNLARKADVALRSIETAPAVEEEQLVKTPVRFKAMGRREALSQFLTELAGQNWNIRLSKVLLVPADWHRSVRDRLLTLVVELDLCEPM